MILLLIVGGILIVLLAVFINILRLQRKDREQLQRRRNERRVEPEPKATMNEDDMKKYMPAILYQEIKGYL